jgi:propionyl-CoA synthetase
MVALKWSMKNLYGVDPGDVYWAASDVGWVVGHSYIVYAPLFHGCTSILYEGKPVGTPDAGAFWRVIAEHGCAAMFTAPTAFRAIKKEDPQGKFLAQYDLTKFRTLFLAGERADPDTIMWAEKLLKVPVVDHWWQTETGWAIAGNPVGLGMLPVKYGSPTVVMPGYESTLVDEPAARLPAQPWARSWSSCRCRRRACRRCGKTTSASGKLPRRFPGTTRPRRRLQGRGRLRLVMGRTDDIINVAGQAVDRRHGGGAGRAPRRRRMRAWSASRTRSRARCRAASSCSRPASTAADEIEKEIVALCARRSARSRRSSSPSRWAAAEDALRQNPARHHEEDRRRRAWTMPATIDDPVILDEIGSALKGHGLGGKRPA